jgi:hypothetical protein
MDKETEKRIKELEKKVSILEDIEAIQRLQRSYGYYLEHWMYDEIIDCFADAPDTELNIMVGIYLGKEGVRRYFSGEIARYENPEVFHQVMQLSGVVDIAKDRKTAQGRWYGWGATALPVGKGVMQNITDGIYTAEYLKENGKWKIWKLIWNPAIMSDPTVGWVKPERVAKATIDDLTPAPRPDKPRKIQCKYPSGYIPPFHYPHPVTGKPTTEKKHNDLMKKTKAK